MNKKVLVGLSGGADSAACARLLMERGYDVHGAFLALTPDASCEGAARVAERLGIPFTVVERRELFHKRVIRPFFSYYRKGLTPNPCVECNRKIKIASLMEEADRQGILTVATGHYARIVKEGGRYGLWEAQDKAKDQSYFLWKLTQGQLARLIFPLAERNKGQALHHAADLIPREQKESMELCFVPRGETRSYLQAHVSSRKGEFVNQKGEVLGRHEGVLGYTVGQRKGLGVALGERYFVIDTQPESGRVVLGRREELFTDRLYVGKLHYVSATRGNVPTQDVLFRGRHRGSKIPCRLTWDGSRVEVRFSEPQTRFAAGQSACFYQGEKLLFGGEILREEKNGK